MRFTLKSDGYRESRGGYARFLNIFCAKCNSHVLLYQKDGPGPLKRLYLDRIFAPKQLSNLPESSNLVCSKCKSLLGKPMLYEKEKRRAIELISGTFSKKLTKGFYRPA